MKIGNYIKFLISVAILEDLGTDGKDITTNDLIPKEMRIKAEILAKQSGVIAGLDIAKEVFLTIDRAVKFKAKTKDGQFVNKGKVLAEITGFARSILIGERVALNFLQHLCGIATLTRAYVEKIKPYRCGIFDTRKTTPGLRALEKYAVTVGGGNNHRFGLFDGILIKNNHLKTIGNILPKLQTGAEVEARNLSQAIYAVKAGASIVMLDNMKISDMRKAVKKIKKINSKIAIEASGGVNIFNVRQIASAGVDRISVGKLTHSAPALDISLIIL